MEQREAKVQSPEELFYELLAKMPENMRLHDKLAGEKIVLYKVKEDYAETLEDLDIESPPRLYPENVAYDALGLYMTDRKILALQKQINGLNYQGDWTKFLSLHGRKVEVEPLSDRRIDHSTEGAFLKGSSRKKSGSVTDISLTPSDGGWVKFKGKFAAGLEWQAAPLFDINNDYAPLFRVELL